MTDEPKRVSDRNRTFIILGLLAGLVALTWFIAGSRGFARPYWFLIGLFQEGLGFDPEAAEIMTMIVRKLFHMPPYAVMGALLFLLLVRSSAPPRSSERARKLLCLGIVLGVATLDETIQSMRPGRSGRATDVLLDLAGAWIGVWGAARLSRR